MNGFEDNPIRIRWGKHKGKIMEDIPSSYLKWLAGNAEDDDIAEAADKEYEWREEWNKHWED